VLSNHKLLCVISLLNICGFTKSNDMKKLKENKIGENVFQKKS